MTNKEQKNAFVLAIAIVMALLAIASIFDNGKSEGNDNKVSQWTFSDGVKITIAWSVFEDEPHYDGTPQIRYYYGCINDGLSTCFWYMSAEQWYKVIYEKETTVERISYEILTEWRW